MATGHAWVEPYIKAKVFASLLCITTCCPQRLTARLRSVCHRPSDLLCLRSGKAHLPPTMQFHRLLAHLHEPQSKTVYLSPDHLRPLGSGSLPCRVLRHRSFCGRFHQLHPYRSSSSSIIHMGFHSKSASIQMTAS
jgi:hypothetical protein